MKKTALEKSIENSTRSKVLTLATDIQLLDEFLKIAIQLAFDSYTREINHYVEKKHIAREGFDFEKDSAERMAYWYNGAAHANMSNLADLRTVLYYSHKAKKLVADLLNQVMEGEQ